MLDLTIRLQQWKISSASDAGCAAVVEVSSGGRNVLSPAQVCGGISSTPLSLPPKHPRSEELIVLA